MYKFWLKTTIAWWSWFSTTQTGLLYLNGWKGLLLRGAAFTRNAARWSPLTLVAEPQPSLLGLFYDLNIYSVLRFVGGSSVRCLFLWLGGLGLSHRNLRGHEWFLILCCLNKKIFTYKVAIICCLPLMCYILFVHKSSHFYTPIICINSESVLVFSGHTDRIKTRMKYK